MESARIKIKIGQHEFEAEGPSDVVQAQFEIFKKLIENEPKQNEQKPSPLVPPAVPPATTPAPGNNTEIQLDRICKVEGRVISLTVKPESEAVAGMLIMLGHKVYRDNDAVTASEIKDGLERSGYRVERLDRIMQPLADDGSLVRIGARKGTRYRFTNPGFAKAQAAARKAISEVA
jgi:hypothetical protein